MDYQEYLSELQNSVLADNSSKEGVNGNSTLTIKVDIDAKIYCDGDFLELVEANVVKKIPIEVGQHLITIESENVEGVSEDREVDIKEAGKNYLLLVNGMKQQQEKKRLETEPYAVLSDNNDTLTFYYDHLKKQRGGMDLDIIEKEECGCIFTNTRWDEQSEKISTVIFDDSFSRCHCIHSTELWFCGMKSLTSISGFHNLDTMNVSNMACMFEDCSSLQELDLSHFDTRNVTDMSSMFRGCSSLQKLDLSHFDTRNVENMGFMFQGCSSLQELDLSHFNTRNVENMGFMFSGCISLHELDLSQLDTKNVSDMAFMFSGCTSLHELDLSHFNTRNVTDMSSMFRGCSSLQELDIRGFKMEELLNDDMFEGVNNNIIHS